MYAEWACILSIAFHLHAALKLSSSKTALYFHIELETVISQSEQLLHNNNFMERLNFRNQMICFLVVFNEDTIFFYAFIITLVASVIYSFHLVPKLIILWEIA